MVLTSNGYVLSEAPQRWGPLTAVPDEEQGSRQLLLDRLSEQGYLYLPGFLDPRTVAGFRRHYFATLAGTGLIAAGTDPEDGVAGAADEVDQAALRTRLFRQIVPSPEYRGFCEQARIKDWFAWLLDDEVYLHRRKIIRHTRPDEHRDPQRLGVGSATQAHYDLLYLREGSDQVLSMWIPLGDCPRELGGLIYLEGSHRWVIAEEAAGHLRPDVRHAQQVEHTRRNLGLQLRVELEIAGVEQLADLVSDRLADPRNVGQVAALAQGRQRHGESDDRVAGAVIGPGAKDILAQNLHRVGDRVENVGDLAIC